jgi:hypothetical protein
MTVPLLEKLGGVHGSDLITAPLPAFLVPILVGLARRFRAMIVAASAMVFIFDGIDGLSMAGNPGRRTLAFSIRALLPRLTTDSASSAMALALGQINATLSAFRSPVVAALLLAHAVDTRLMFLALSIASTAMLLVYL